MHRSLWCQSVSINERGDQCMLTRRDQKDRHQASHIAAWLHCQKHGKINRDGERESETKTSTLFSFFKTLSTRIYILSFMKLFLNHLHRFKCQFKNFKEFPVKKSEAVEKKNVGGRYP